jgi:prepilin-type N-terminal cleavage/methylation domain-containing protein
MMENKIKIKNKMNNKKGFSLVEVMVAAVILSIIGLAVSQTTTNMFKATKSNSQSIDAQTLQSQIAQILSDSANCRQNFGPPSVGGAISLGSTNQTRDLYAPNGGGGWLVAYDVDSATSYLNNSLLVKSWKYEQSQIISPTEVVGTLTLNLEKVGDVVVGGKTLNKSIVMNTTLTGPGGTITDCYAMSASATAGATVACTAGKYVSALNDGVPICTDFPTRSFTCTVGQQVTSFDANGSPVCTPSASGPDYSAVSSGSLSWQSVYLNNTGGPGMGYTCGTLSTVTLTDSTITNATKAAILTVYSDDTYHESPAVKFYNMSDQIVGLIGRAGRDGDGRGFGMGGDITVPLTNKQFKMRACRLNWGVTVNFAVKAAIN